MIILHFLYLNFRLFLIILNIEIVFKFLVFFCLFIYLLRGDTFLRGTGGVIIKKCRCHIQKL